MKKIFHLSHTDLDGYGCQAVVEHFRTGTYQMYRGSSIQVKKTMPTKEPNIKLDVEYFNSNYGEEITKSLTLIFNLMNRYRGHGNTDEMLLLITDLNLTEDQAKFVEENIKNIENAEVVLLDHHISGKDVAKDRKWYRLDITDSATMQTFFYLFKMFYPDTERSEDSIMSLAKIINAYDLWREDKEKEFAIGKLFSFYLNTVEHFVPRKVYQLHHDGIVRDLVFYVSYNYPNDKMVYDLFRHVIIEFVKDTYELKEYPASLQDALELLDVKDMVSELENAYSCKASVLNAVSSKNHINADIRLELGIFVSDKHMSSSVMNKVLKEKPELNAIMVVNHSGTASIRSTGKLDVSVLAKLLGGGGHACASGCKFERKDENTTTEKYLEYIINKIADAYYVEGMKSEE